MLILRLRRLWLGAQIFKRIVDRTGNALCVGVLQRDHAQLTRRVVLLGIKLLEQQANARPLRLFGRDDQRIGGFVADDAHALLRRRVGVKRARAVEITERFLNAARLALLQRHELGDAPLVAANVDRLDNILNGAELLGRRRNDQPVLRRIGLDPRSFDSWGRALARNEIAERARDFVRRCELQRNDAEVDGRLCGRLLELRQQLLDDWVTFGRRRHDQRIRARVGNDAGIHLNRGTARLKANRDSLRPSLGVELQRVRQNAHCVFGLRRLQREGANDGFFGACGRIELLDERLDLAELQRRRGGDDAVGTDIRRNRNS